MRLEAAKLAKYHAARLYDASKTDRLVKQDAVGVAANSAKYLAAEAAFFSCERAILTHGGMGYAAEFDVERFFRRLKGFRRIFSRFEKLDAMFTAFIHIALIFDALLYLNTP